MQPANEVNRCRLRQTVLGGHAIDLGLDAYMRSRLDLQIPPLFIVVEMSRERALYVFGPGVMASMRLL
jgi:hypothetical protein